MARIGDDQLKYAQPPPWHRRRVWRRGLLAGALAAIALSAVWWGPAALRHVGLLYWQQRCLNYAPAAGEIAYQSADATRSSQSHVPVEWSRFYELHSPPGAGDVTVLFLGRRSTPEGGERLVVVQLGRDGRAYPRVFHVNRLTGAREIASHGQTTLPIQGKSATVYRGIKNEQDSARFIIEYEVDGEPAIADGWLRADDSVVIEPRE